MKILRGTNLEGYAGIKRISYLENYKIIRPLIEITKNDGTDYTYQDYIQDQLKEVQ